MEVWITHDRDHDEVRFEVLDTPTESADFDRLAVELGTPGMASVAARALMQLGSLAVMWSSDLGPDVLRLTAGGEAHFCLLLREEPCRRATDIGPDGARLRGEIWRVVG